MALAQGRHGALARVCLFAALIAALGLIPKLDLPFGVPVTAQTMGVMLAGVALGPRLGALASALFVAVVALGLPFLAGGRGGLGVVFGPTGGFLLGFVPGAFVAGLAMERLPVGSQRLRAFIAALLGGVGAVYLCGVPWLALVAGLSLKQALAGSLMFLPGDVLKAALVAFLAPRLPSRVAS